MPLQGAEGIWVYGVYTRDIDSHESAVASGIAIGERLAPGATMLAQLRRGRLSPS